MSQLPDSVIDSRLQTEFRDSIITHTYLENDNAGRRFSREEHWKSEQFLGRGGFGQVRLERCIAEGKKQNSLRAVKIISKPLDPSSSFDFKRELATISRFSKDRYKRWFVEFFGWFEDRSSIFIAMEYCRYGDLHHYLVRQPVVAVNEVQQLSFQILEAVDQMHQHDFAHRDLKPGNILIKSMPPDGNWWIVLADFGISKRADESSGLMTTIKGTATFMAPELLGFLDQFRPKSIADFKATDMWALGEIVFQMLTGEATFRNPMELMTYCFGQREFPLNRLPISAGDDCHRFVASIMTTSPHDRMTTAQSLQHRWMKSLYIEEAFTALNLEYTRPLVPEIPQNESASARWSSLSPTQTTALPRPTHLNSSSVRQTRIDTVSLNLEHTRPLVPEIPRNESASARWSSLSPTQTTALQRPTQLNSSSVRQTRLGSISSNLPIQQYPNTDPEPFVFATAPVETLEGHISRVRSVAFSHDATRLASGSLDGQIKIWDVTSGKCLQTLKGHTVSVFSVAFSHDSTRVVSGLRDFTVMIWDATSGECLQTLKGHSRPVYSVAFSHDSTRVVSGSGDWTVMIWDATSGECLQTLNGHRESVYSVAFSHNSTRLASGSDDGTVKIWNISSDECLQTLKSHSEAVWSVAFSYDSTQLALGLDNSSIRIWDISTGECLQTLNGHSGPVRSVAFSHDSTHLASGSEDGTVVIWAATKRSRTASTRSGQ